MNQGVVPVEWQAATLTHQRRSTQTDEHTNTLRIDIQTRRLNVVCVCKLQLNQIPLPCLRVLRWLIQCEFQEQA